MRSAKLMLVLDAWSEDDRNELGVAIFATLLEKIGTRRRAQFGYRGDTLYTRLSPNASWMPILICGDDAARAMLNSVISSFQDEYDGLELVEPEDPALVSTLTDAMEGRR